MQVYGMVMRTVNFESICINTERKGESVNSANRRNNILKCWCDRPFDLDDQAELKIGTKENHGRS